VRAPLSRAEQSRDLMNFELNPLPFAEDALEPYISQRTVGIHYHKHHQGYLDKLDTLLASDNRRTLTLEAIVRSSEGEVYNNAAQVWNHSFYWKSIEPRGKSKPARGPLLEQIKANFGSLGALNTQLKAVAASQFGTGWAWLVFDNVTSSLQVTNTGDAENPLTGNCVPLLTIDVWEHAYYLDYQSERGRYLDAFISHLINWEFANDNFVSRPVQ
jgi:Fe-Mn family superoxide dismutase